MVLALHGYATHSAATARQASWRPSHFQGLGKLAEGEGSSTNSLKVAHIAPARLRIRK